MIYIFILFILCFSLGIYFITADIFKLPAHRTSRAVLNFMRQGKKKTKIIDTFILNLSMNLSRFIHLDEYKKRKMTATLKHASINLTPETFYIRAWIKVCLILLIIVPAILVFPLIVPIILFLAIVVYFKEIRSAEELLRGKRDSLERELPRFVLTIEQELKSSRDVLSILETYKKNAGDVLREELEITVADMKSGNFESALIRFETRFGSSMLSDVTRGLLSVLRGDDGVTYFQMLARDFKEMQFRKLKQEAMKKPHKIRKYSFLMLGCFVVTYLVIMLVEILETLGRML